MKRGDYRIHVFIEKTKDLKVPKDSTVDPIIEISCLGLKKYSSSKTKISGIEQVIWSEHLFLEPKNVEQKAAEEGRILVKVLEKGIMRNTTIGQFEFDMSFVYFKKDHAILHQWIALSDPNSEHYDQITGYMKLSINITCQGDEPVQIQDQNEDDNATNIMMPPSLNPQFYQMKIRLFQAQQLPFMDIGIALIKKSKTDAYISTQYKKTILKTEVLTFDQVDKPVEWNQEFWIPAQIPIVQKYLTLRIMDQDDDCDEIIGSIHFDLKKIIDGSLNNVFIWKNIYGSPVKTQLLESQNKQQKKIMDENPDEASTWKGRVLIQMICEKTEKPQVKVERIEDVYLEQSKYFLPLKEYDIIAEVGQGIALPQDKAFRVRIQIGAIQLLTDKGFHKGTTNYNRFNQRIEQKSYKSASQSIQEFEQVFIYLIDENDDPICFYKDKIENFTNPNPEYQWIQFLPDKCINSVKNVNRAGLLSFKLSIHDKSNGLINFKDFDSWKKPPMKRAVPVKIRAYIYQCRDLPAADEDGSSDPYLKIWDVHTGLKSNEKKTKVIQDNVNPLFYECLELEYEIIKDDINDLKCYPPFIVDVFDEDKELFDSSDDYLCRAIIKAQDCSVSFQDQFQNDKSLEIPNIPKWHHLRFAKNEPVCGEVLISFSVSSLDYVYRQSPKKVNLCSTIQYKDSEISMIILGLRQLQSTGFLPVKKAFITFNVKSLAPAAFALQNIQTQPKASGPNPTINTTISFTVPLPVNQLFCPRMSCRVQDYICKGFSQPQIGVFTIPIGDLMIALQKERSEEISNIEDIIQKLEKIIQDGPELLVQDFSQQIKKNINQNDISISSKNSKNRQQIIQQIEVAYSDTQYDNDTEFQRNNSIGSFDNTQIYSGRNQENSFTQLERKMTDVDSNSFSTKTLLKQKNKYSKKLKGSSIENEVKEQLGANQMEADIEAQDKLEQQLQEIQQRKNTVKNTGLLPNQIDGQRRETTAIQKYKKQDNKDNQQLSKIDILKILKEDKEKEKRILEDLRVKAEQDLRYQGTEDANVVIMPKYEQDQRLKVDREINQPNPVLYQALGWDEDRTSERKHYRLFYNDELENIKQIFPKMSPFNSFNILKGQTRGVSKGILSFLNNTKKDASNQISTLKDVGQFKGIIEVESKEDKQNYILKKTMLIEKLKEMIQTISKQKYGKEQNLNIKVENLASVVERQKADKKFRELGIEHLNITKHLSNLESEYILKRQLMGNTKCIVRFYAIDADHLSSRDIGSESDPYLYLTCNDKIYNERDQYQLDISNPKFLKYYDFEGTFPGCSPLKVDIYDYDDIFGDDLIGSTSIDLEDRFFSLEWQSLPEKPIEVRQIYIDSCSIDQGTIKCWVEIIDIDNAIKNQIWDISEKPPETLEVRVCVFNCKNVKMMDIEGTSDVYCRGYFDSQEDVQETDTHYRNQDGKPDFQYRFIFKIQVPRKDYNFTLQMYDRDLIGSNELIGSTQINLKNLIQDCQLIKKPLGMSKDYYKQVLTSNGQIYQKLDFDGQDQTRFWLEMKQKNEHGNLEVNGQVKVKIDVLPIQFAEKNKVGKARDSPNHSPLLPQPEGRIEFTLNPLKMINQLFSQTFLYKVYCALCLILCVILILAILPNILGELIAKAI